MKKQINLDALDAHLFETIEMLKNNNDPQASDNEKMKPETAKQIIEAAKVIVASYKVKADVVCALASGGYTKEMSTLLGESNLIALEAKNIN